MRVNSNFAFQVILGLLGIDAFIGEMHLWMKTKNYDFLSKNLSHRNDISITRVGMFLYVAAFFFRAKKKQIS